MSDHQNIDAPPARLIINPKAGRGRGHRYARRIRKHLQNSGIRFRVSFSRAAGDIEQQVLDACLEGCERVVVVGGDGTVHEAANGLLRGGASTAMGLIPLGSGNDFAKALGVPLAWRDACDAVAASIRSGQVRRVDAARCGDFYFANGIGIGLDAMVTLGSLPLKWLPGSVSYVLSLVGVLAKGIPRAHAKIESEEGVIETDVCMAVTCNGQWVGGVFHLAPRARLDTGRLQLVLVDPVTRFQAMRWAPRVMRGTHQSLPVVRFLELKKYRIVLDRGLPVEADGEVRFRAATKLEIEVLPGALRVLA